ncbi:alpha/beta-hydrolase [Cryphonectria parasitica EP155]|uniref:Carboxylic ester hydrolase n=1 Tax=Cryphonectria parasitica (strain ATCC 38755 / EP155) TaxID=660469 RepID=A0A9P5CKF3_CRYP1|nr:alpha/beta-hydrolase [Cryphonectria parasitica EP155]KAF3762018.1 alpha/beta-hydrolase [Cryphonectria parasitica EP155]
MGVRVSRDVRAALIGLPLAQAALYSGVVQTEYGPVQGYQAFNESQEGLSANWADVAVWKGIPFAATTAGENRWRPPQAANPWNTTFDAGEFGNICPGVLTDAGTYTVSEDCLNLNVWSSANSSDAKLPVVMWSCPAESTAADSEFNGGGMADAGVVFVSYNSRTGVLGSLATPELSEERYEAVGVNSSGNWAMLDQQAALKWIHANIAAFGGDPDHITVQGQSAGSAASYHVVNSPLVAGLIVGAIIESGVRDPHDPLCTSLAEAYDNQTTAIAHGEEYLTSLGVSTIAEARNLSLDTVLAATFGGKTAAIDYYAMPSTYLEELLQGPANDVPIITGNTRDESGATYDLQLTYAEYLQDLNETFSGEWFERFFEAYPANESGNAGVPYNAQWSDRSKVGTYFWTLLWQISASSPVYNYYWDHAPPGQSSGAYHESEIYYALNNLYANAEQFPWTADDYAIAQELNGYWVNFIKTGNPNGGNLTYWPAASNASQAVQHVGDGWGQIPVAHDYQVQLFSEWFNTLVAY